MNTHTHAHTLRSCQRKTAARGPRAPSLPPLLSARFCATVCLCGSLPGGIDPPPPPSLSFILSIDRDFFSSFFALLLLLLFLFPARCVSFLLVFPFPCTQGRSGRIKEKRKKKTIYRSDGPMDGDRHTHTHTHTHTHRHKALLQRQRQLLLLRIGREPGASGNEKLNRQLTQARRVLNLFPLPSKNGYNHQSLGVGPRL